MPRRGKIFSFPVFLPLSPPLPLFLMYANVFPLSLPHPPPKTYPPKTLTQQDPKIHGVSFSSNCENEWHPLDRKQQPRGEIFHQKKNSRFINPLLPLMISLSLGWGREREEREVKYNITVPIIVKLDTEGRGGGRNA